MAAGDTADALRDRVRAYLGEVSESGILTADIWKFLNRAQHNLVRRLNDNAMPEMLAVASGTLTNSRVALPSDFVRERFVEFGATDIRSRRWNISELDALDNNTLTAPSTTTPFYFLWYDVTDGALRLKMEVGDDASTGAYKLHYVKQPTDMDTDTDPILSADKHHLLIYYALWLGWHQLQEPEQAERMWAQYIQGINRINARHSRLHKRRNESKPGDAA